MPRFLSKASILHHVLHIILICLFTSPTEGFTADSTSFNPVPIQVTAKNVGVPVGTIIAWPAALNPSDMENWLECKGQAVSQAAYPELYAVVGGKIPDLRNQFLRGGTSAQVGQIASDSTRSHGHTIPAHAHTVSGSAGSQTVTVGKQTVTGTASAQTYTDMWTDIGHGGYSLKEGSLSELGHQVRDSSPRSTSGGTISGTTSGGTYTTGGGSITGWTNAIAQSTDATGGAETAPQHIRVRYLIRAKN